MLRALSLCTCCRHYPGAAAGRRLRSSHPAVSAFPDNVVGSACTSSFSRVAQRSLALRPAHSRRHQYVTCYTEGFSHFVTSMTAPVASGWSVWPGGTCTHWKAPPFHGARQAAVPRRLRALVKSTLSGRLSAVLGLLYLRTRFSNKVDEAAQALMLVLFYMTREGAPCPKPGRLRRSSSRMWSAIAGSRAWTKIDNTWQRLRALRSDLIDPTVAVHHGRVVRRTADGSCSKKPPHESTRAHGPAAAADCRRGRFARGCLSRGARSLHRVVQDDREHQGRKSSLRSAGHGC